MSGALPVPAPAPVSMAQARFLPVIGDGMAPTLKPGQAVAVVPVEGYYGEGLYVLRVFVGGAEEIMRCQVNPEWDTTILASYDNPAYGDHRGRVYAAHRDYFHKVVVGRVAAIFDSEDAARREGLALA